MNTSSAYTAQRSARGFTLIEVLVSLIILSVGLLGLGLLQAQSLKSSYGSNHHTVATNLAYEVLDEMRANRLIAYQFAYISAGDFGSISPTTCDPAPMPITETTLVSDDIKGWECQVVRNLPGATAAITLVNGTATVTIVWQDQRYQVGSQNNTFSMRTEL